MGNIIQLKQSDQTKAYPKTVAEAVYMADGTNVEEEIKNIHESAYVEDTLSGSIITIDNAAENVPLDPFKATIEPIQDLHGYDSPWPAGGGVNKFDPSIASGNSVYGLSSTINSATGLVTISGTYNGSASSASFAVLMNVPYITDTKILVFEMNNSFQDHLLYSTSPARWGNTTNGNIAVDLKDLVSGEAYTFTFKPMICANYITPTSWTPYSNICPITGKTGMTVYRTGKNLASMPVYGTESICFDAGCDISWPVTVSVKFTNQIINGQTNAGFLSFTKEDGTLQYVTLRSFKDSEGNLVFNDHTSGDTYTGVYHYTSNFTFRYLTVFYVSVNYSRFANDGISEFLMELGAKPNAYTPSYEPYTGNSYPISWQTEAGTVYGGELDIANGKLTVNRAAVDLGTLTWTYQAGSTRFYSTGLSDVIKPAQTSGDIANVVCSNYKTYSLNGLGLNATLNGCAISSTKNVYIKDLNYDDTSDFTSAVSGVQLVYELATPITYTLTPTEIKTLLGKNVIWSDANSLEVEYAADINTVVTDLKADLASANSDISTLQSELAEAEEEIETLKDSAYVPGTASGTIATFSDGAAADVKALTVNVEPIQNLNGYDSPWPAGGGKNLIPYPYYSSDGTYGGIAISTRPDGKIVGSGTNTGSILYYLSYGMLLKAGTYTLSVKGSHAGVSAYVRDNVKAVTIASISSGDSDSHVTFTISEDVNDARIYLNGGDQSGLNINISAYIQLELGSTATSYAPYSNICPISGRTGATVTRTGKNLIDQSIFADWGMTLQSDGSYYIETSLAIRENTLFENTKQISGSFYIAVKYKYSSDSSSGARFVVKYTDNTETPLYMNATTEYAVYTYTTRSDKTVDKIDVSYGSGSISTWWNVSVSLTPIDKYVPYTGTTIPINWETEAGTVYGGELDVVSGVLTVDRKNIDLGTLSWNYSAPGNPFFYATIEDIKRPSGWNAIPNWICSGYKTLSGNSVSGGVTGIGGNPNNSQVRVCDLCYTDAVTFAEAVQGVQFVYELATPQTYQLTGQQIQTLLGENVVYSDAGSVSVDYRADAKSYINSLFDSIQKNMAFIEDGTTASRAYTTGQYVIVNGTMYKVAAAIASGATFTPGTNIIATTVGTELTTALS